MSFEPSDHSVQGDQIESKDLFLPEAPPLSPAWTEYENKNGLADAQPPRLSQSGYDALKARQQNYSRDCISRNSRMLSSGERDHHLLEGIQISREDATARDGHIIPIRLYSPPDLEGERHLIIYYHGGALRVGDLNSEDLTCRRICKEARVKVMSVDYRLLPDYHPDTAVNDAWDAFVAIHDARKQDLELPPGKTILVGSSSGGQLAAQVSQLARGTEYHITGVVLRCPVTVDASEGGIYIPSRFQRSHTSFGPSFESSLLGIDAVALPKASSLPLAAESFKALPRTWIQVCTNDIYYSDGLCYYEALKMAGNDVQISRWEGFPHTFWLKAPELEESLQADVDMLGFLKGVLRA